jgi:S1-C subfamily serine protease
MGLTPRNSLQHILSVRSGTPISAHYGGISETPEPGSPAVAAKIEAGDLITTINDTPLMNAQDFSPAIAAMAPGSTLYLSIRRNGQPREISLILGSGKCETGQ